MTNITITKQIFTGTMIAGLSLAMGGMSSAMASADHHGTAAQGKSVSAAVKAALKNPHRKEGDAARDQYRHPAKVLSLFGITKDSAVGEVNPGGMWYSRVLGPLLKDSGTYAGMEHHPASYAAYPAYANRNLKPYRQKMAGMGDIFGDRAIASHLFQLDSPVKDGSLDVVMVVRAMHNWQRRGFMDGGLAEVHSKLKDGGILGVVQHREPETSDKKTEDSVKNGRWKQSELIKKIEENGFKLVTASEMNANPKDDGTLPVWALPPSLGGPEKGKEERRAIGESDRMTLKFMKVNKAK